MFPVSQDDGLQNVWHVSLLSVFLSLSQLEAELALCEREGAELQEYANQVLQQIADRCPDILEQVVNALEDSCWHTGAHRNINKLIHYS